MRVSGRKWIGWLIAASVGFGLGGVVGGTVVADVEAAPLPATKSARAEHRVLLVGDSLTSWQGDLPEQVRAERGLPGTIVNAAIGSSTPCAPAPIDWRATLAGLLEQHAPDTVVFEFVGHEPEGGPWEACVLTLVEMVDDARVRFVVPPVSGAWWCQWDHPETAKISRHVAWIRDELPVLRPEVELIDWRHALSADETYDPRYRENRDCVHLNDAGEQIAADLTVDRIWSDRRVAAG